MSAKCYTAAFFNVEVQLIKITGPSVLCVLAA